MGARVLARREDGSEIDMTEQVEKLWWLIPDAVSIYTFDLDTCRAALAVALAAGLPSELLETEHANLVAAEQRRADREAMQAAKEAHLSSPVDVVLAHPCYLRDNPARLTRAGTAVTITLGEAVDLDRYGRLVRPNPISPKPVEAL